MLAWDGASAGRVVAVSYQMGCACHPRTLEEEAGASEVRSHSYQRSDLEASLGCHRTDLSC